MTPFFYVLLVVIVSIAAHQSWWWREELRLRRVERRLKRDDSIRRLERELDLPSTVPAPLEVVDFSPSDMQLNVNDRFIRPGDRFTLRCTWPGCGWSVTTEASETVYLEGNNIPGGDMLLRHQADYGHWTSNIRVGSNSVYR